MTKKKLITHTVPPVPFGKYKLLPRSLEWLLFTLGTGLSQTVMVEIQPTQLNSIIFPDSGKITESAACRTTSWNFSIELEHYPHGTITFCSMDTR